MFLEVGGMAILLFDYVITIQDEVRWIWRRSWDATRVIFTLSRYLPFLGTALTAHVALCSNSDACPSSNAENGDFFALSVSVSGSSRSNFQPPTSSDAYPRWQRVTIGAAIAINLSPDQLLALVILALMVYKLFHAYRGCYTLVVRIMYRDGVFYVLCIIYRVQRSLGNVRTLSLLGP
ncbi:hypothetical protein BU15DRAFT_63307 [Melanogaster broomeanus]|nr:hypothetical protein BU15DRAFT_63307 [Melanogaster broomeanus]